MKNLKIPDHTDSNGNTWKDCTWIVPETPEERAQMEAEAAIGRAQCLPLFPVKKWWQFWK